MDKNKRNNKTKNKEYAKSVDFFRSKNVFQFSIGKDALFVTAAPFKSKDKKTGNATYDYDKKIVMALNPMEIGAIIMHIENFNSKSYKVNEAASINPKGQGFFHTTGKNESKQLYFKKNDNSDTPSFNINIVQKSKGKSYMQSTLLSLIDCRVLKEMLLEGIKIIYNWELALNN